MNNGINLLVDKRTNKFLTSTKGSLRIFRFGAIGILFLVGVSSVILSILISLSSLPKLRENEKKARSEFAVFATDVVNLNFINERGNSIRKILAGRPSYDKKIDIIQSKMQADVAIDELSIVKKNYTLTCSSSNLTSLNDLLDGLTAIAGKGRDFSRIYLNSLSVDEDNKKFVLVVNLLAI